MAFIAPVTTPRQPDTAHPAFPERPIQGVSAEASPGEIAEAEHVDGAALQKSLALRERMSRQQLGDFVAQRRVLHSHLRESSRPLSVVQIQQFVQERPDDLQFAPLVPGTEFPSC